MGDEVKRANQATELIKSKVTNVKIRKFISGGVAGCIAKGIISPFDRIKILRQGEHKVHGNLSILRSAKTIVQTEGLGQLWRGFPSLVLRIFPYAGIQFLCFDIYKDNWNFKKDIKVGNFNVPFRNLSCGAMTGVTATMFTYPLDTIRTRMLFTTKNDQEYKTWLRTANSIKSHSGWGGFYNGLRPALAGMVFYAGISFGTYETLKESVVNSKQTDFCGIKIKHNTSNGVITEWYVNSVCGMTAGLLSQFICFPIDTAKRRMQNANLIKSQAALKDRLSVIATWKDLWKRGGIRLVYKGFSLNVIRVIPATATSFTVNEKLHELFGVPRLIK